MVTQSRRLSIRTNPLQMKTMLKPIPQSSPLRLAITIFAIVLPTLITYIYFTRLDGAPAWQQKLSFSIGKVIQFGLPVFVFWKLGSWINHDNPKFKSSSIWGVVTGLAIGVSMYLLYRFALTPFGVMAIPDREVDEKLQSLQLNSITLYVAVGIGYAFVHSLLEEYYWRWFVFGNLQQYISLPWAILISSLGFASHHVLVLANYFGWNSGWTYLCALGVAVGGAIWAWLYQRYQTLLGPWISHGIVDAAIFYIGYELAF
jgi:uncharacterized protein